MFRTWPPLKKRGTSCWPIPTTTTPRTGASAGRELGRVQLGAGLVRRDRREQRPHRPVDRRGGRHRAALVLRASCPRRSNRVANWLRAQGVRARRPDDPHARQPGRAVGDGPRRDEAAAPSSSRRPRCSARPTCATGSTAARARHVIVARPRTPPSSTRSPGDYTRIAVGGAGRTAGCRTRTPYARRRRASRRTGRPRPTTRCCSTSPPAPPPSPSWSSTPTPRTRSGTCPRCTGSGCGPATCT